MAMDINDNILAARIPDAGHHIRFAKYATYMDLVGAFLAQLDA